eukprot:scaffold35520_cov30-Attheya_sp.AAC.1
MILSSSSSSRDSSRALTSSDQARNSAGYSDPSESDVATGRQLLNESLRSIVMSRTAFSLFHGFNPTSKSVYWIHDVGCSTAVTSGSSSGNDAYAPIPNFTKFTVDEDYSGLLLQSFKKATNEVGIKKEMASLLHDVLDKRYPQKITTFVEAEAPISSNKKKAPRLDVTLGAKEGGTLNGFVEVGLTPVDTPDDYLSETVDQLFWKKVDLAINYLRLVSTEGVEGKDADGEEFKLHVYPQKTLLLCVIVMTRKKCLGRIAIFACEPKKKGEWRMALMWRKEGKKQEISQAFGYYVAAIKYMMDHQFNLDVEQETWNYM